MELGNTIIRGMGKTESQILQFYDLGNTITQGMGETANRCQLSAGEDAEH